MRSAGFVTSDAAVLPLASALDSIGFE